MFHLYSRGNVRIGCLFIKIQILKLNINTRMETKLKKIIRIFTNPIWALSIFVVRYPHLIKDDETYLKWCFYHRMHQWPDLKNPQTFNEKLNWLKLHHKNPFYTQLVDKYAVKEWIEQQNIGVELIPTLGVWDRFDDIDFDKLPNQFVLKCTHNSGGLVICKNKKELNKHKAKVKIEKSLRQNYFYSGREYPYKHVKPRIIAEQYMVDESGTELKDYKFFCFNGVPKFFKIDFGRFISHHANYYSIDGKLLPFGEAEIPPLPDKQLPLPKSLPQMINIAQKLAQGIPFVRVDLYEINGKVYFGEITFYPASGTGKFTPPEWDAKIGQMLTLHN